MVRRRRRMEGRMEFLNKSLGRYDFYINTTNAKCSIVLAFNSFIIGALLLKFDEILKIYCQNLYFKGIATFMLCMIGVVSSISIIFAFRVINPFLQSGTEGGKSESIIYFGSVSKMSLSRYVEEINSKTDNEIIEDLVVQVKTLADGLTQKMSDMRRAVKFIYAILILVICLFILKGVLSYA
jgi:hypothetical protein